MRRVILMLMLMSLTISAEVKTYKDYSIAVELTGDSFNYIVIPQKQECESLWNKDKNTIYQTISITLNDKAMLDFLSHKRPDLKGLRVISKPMMEEYVPDASWESYHKFTMFYLFSSLDACNAALPTIKEEAVVMKEKAKEISEKMREKHDRILKENKETVE
ncbi:MAG: hypothetical protein A3E21_04925 [Sulfurimonas sp. RIFCSPHIGHO2_12_FULL_36_9]|uniref:hypothetical protein n=1 Tax=Sulfurimonas sp. RIFCSPLOWO2_12_36_12 TaxID=1802253 RepID=UPI0008B98289|nr:hypothetical protein [Sulfurimonas sp. RIFCSPLOWO2_12_36_12]OHD98066.1 MAG: hypothetical protein A3J26_02135 [Sulfurimonas sp. RIFCSPLOWO2_02_FULL_36_28]OHD99021.1 MAG: hypothetical protein A3E21_04925 [Sulfurimonas sp. RIFCSPHIGHO2_12_FULL_36_9]OHE01465.1 MAG: hypothetical protein A2W82_02430 [Sulfurimonas sp. RIFCSPLOWO2_12_36_12]OHE07080.1 MAG: hypothetical protein A3K14_07535 [Sulfurimonas sp. RIFCSPLOWO2_12_FULL_36_74]